jgi:hypothetical protein
MLASRKVFGSIRSLHGLLHARQNGDSNSTLVEPEMPSKTLILPNSIAEPSQISENLWSVILDSGTPDQLKIKDVALLTSSGVLIETPEKTRFPGI